MVETKDVRALVASTTTDGKILQRAGAKRVFVVQVGTVLTFTARFVAVELGHRIDMILIEPADLGSERIPRIAGATQEEIRSIVWRGCGPRLGQPVSRIRIRPGLHLGHGVAGND